jgi:ABC-type Zn uptake system ZnuABC Zn-binding protein ZnuA
VTAHRRMPNVLRSHTQWAYILTRFGPPAPAHLTKLIQRMKDDKVKVIIVEPWNDLKLSEPR